MSDAPFTPEFYEKAPIIMRHLVEVSHSTAWPSGVPSIDDEDAAAVVGNFSVETGGFTLRQEVGKPNKDSTGFGWAQWTGMDPGERRLLFEQWCNANGYGDVVDEPDDSPEARYDAACMGYFIYEISKTWEKRVLTEGGTISGVFYPPLKDCPTLEKKTTSFMRLFERPGTPHEDWRHEMAHEALRLYRGDTTGAAPMPYNKIVISSGHSLHVRGASGVLDEVDEARRVTERLADELRSRGVEIKTFHDDTSQSQNENLNTIVDYHNDQERDLDISVHFNAYVETDNPMGTEVLYVTQDELAGQVSEAIASCGFIDRGGKKRSDLFFLNNTDMPAILLEVCFVDSQADADVYGQQFEAICTAIANVLGGEEEGVIEPPPGEIVEPPPTRPPGRPGVLARVDIEVSGPAVVTVNRVPVN